MAYKLAIFDLDGTLLNTLDDLAYSVNFALAFNGHPTRSYDEIRSFLGFGARNLCKSALPDGVSEDVITKTLTDFRAHYKENCTNTTSPYDGVCDMLSKLQKMGVKTAVLSNKPDPSVKPMCAHYFPGLLDAAVGEKPDVPRKPAPDGVFAILDSLGIDRSETVFIGDSEPDIETARNAGIDVIAVTWGFRDVECLKNCGAEKLANSAAQLTEMILDGTDKAEAAVVHYATADITEGAEVKAAVEVKEKSSIREQVVPADPMSGYNPVAEAGKTGLFGAANVLYLINTILSFILAIVGSIAGSAGIIGITVAVCEALGVSTDSIEEFLAPFADSAVMVTVIAGAIVLLISIPNLLINIGVFMTRSACKNSVDGKVKAGGLKLIRTAAVIEAVFAALVSAASLVLSVVLAVTDEYMAALGVSSVVFASVCVLVMAFVFAKLLDSLTNAIDTAEGYYPKKASTLFGVLIILAAVGFLTNLILCLSLIFYAVTLFRYNGKVKKYGSS